MGSQATKKRSLQLSLRVCVFGFGCRLIGIPFRLLPLIRFLCDQFTMAIILQRTKRNKGTDNILVEKEYKKIAL